MNQFESLLDSLLEELVPTRSWITPELTQLPSGKQLALLPVDIWRELLLLSLKRILSLEKQIVKYRDQAPGNMPYGDSGQGELLWQQRQLLVMVVQGLFKRKLPLKQKDITGLLKWPVSSELVFDKTFLPLESILKATKSYAEKAELQSKHLELLSQLNSRLEPHAQHMKYKPLLLMVSELLNGAEPFVVVAGEAWSDKAIADLKSLSNSEFEHWHQLLELCSGAKSAEPNQKWLKRADGVLEKLPIEQVRKLVLPWLALVEKPRTAVIEDFDAFNGDPNVKIIDEHQTILRGLIWLLVQSPDEPTPDKPTIEALGALALSCFEHLPGLGARVLKVGNACLYALGKDKSEASIKQLNLIKANVSNRSILKNIDKALN